jgi:hypothetical protein
VLAVVMVMLAVAVFVRSVTEVAVIVTVLPVGIVAGAEKSVATPLAVPAALKAPQALALPQVTIQVTPAFAGSLATKAVIPIPLEACRDPSLGPKLTAIGAAAVIVMVAWADCVVSVTEVAVTVTGPPVGITVGTV